MHGYELRKQLNTLFGSFRAFSYGSLYPCLKDLLASGLITEDRPAGAGSGTSRSGRRSKIVYRITDQGEQRLRELLDHAGPSTWEDESFGVHFAFFAQTNADVRMRILQGRRRRLEERLENLRAILTRTRERLDSYTLELQQHGLESTRREVRWLNELILREQRAGNDPTATEDLPERGQVGSAPAARWGGAESANEQAP